MPDQDERTLIARATAGENAAIGDLYDAYQESVYRYLHYRLGDRQAAEDLTADVFVRVLKALPRYRQNSLPFRAWLLTIARNLVIDHYRRMSHRNHLMLNEALPSTEDPPEATAERSLLGDRLQQALMTLTEEQREVIILRFISEMPIAQVAHMLNRSESSVKALQRRGLQALRKTLADWKVHYV